MAGKPANFTALNTLTAAQLNALIQFMDDLVPVGAIWAHYDFGAGLTVNSSLHHVCDGSVQNVTQAGTTVSRTLPDLSNRYLVGFGTEAGGDIGTAAWSTTIVGNASHLVTLTGAQSGIQAHSISVSGSISGTAATASLNHRHTFGGSPGGSGGSDGVKDVVAANATFSVYTGYTDLSHSHSVSGSCSATGSVAAADASQSHSIQVRSVKVRYYMRIA